VAPAAGSPERHRGGIERLPSGSLRVRVDAGVDPLIGRRHYLTEVIPLDAGASREAAKWPGIWPRRLRLGSSTPIVAAQVLGADVVERSAGEAGSQPPRNLRSSGPRSLGELTRLALRVAS